MTNFGKKYSGLYDSIYRYKDYDAECTILKDIFEKNNYSGIENVLDLGCGTGKHSLIMTEMGYKITGIDISETMLEQAREKAKIIEAHKRPEYICSDIAEFKIDRQFDAAMSMFAVMGYQYTNDKLLLSLKNIFKHLKSSSLFVFDCWNGIAVLTDPPKQVDKEIQVSREEKYLRHTVPEVDYINNKVYVNFNVEQYLGGARKDEYSEQHIMRYFFPKEIEFYLKTAGFAEVECYPFAQERRALTKDDWDMLVIAFKD